MLSDVGSSLIWSPLFLSLIRILWNPFIVLSFIVYPFYSSFIVLSLLPRTQRHFIGLCLLSGVLRNFYLEPRATLLYKLLSEAKKIGLSLILSPKILSRLISLIWCHENLYCCIPLVYIYILFIIKNIPSGLKGLSDFHNLITNRRTCLGNAIHKNRIWHLTISFVRSGKYITHAQKLHYH